MNMLSVHEIAIQCDISKGKLGKTELVRTLQRSALISIVSPRSIITIANC